MQSPRLLFPFGSRVSPVDASSGLITRRPERPFEFVLSIGLRNWTGTSRLARSIVNGKQGHIRVPTSTIQG